MLKFSLHTKTKRCSFREHKERVKRLLVLFFFYSRNFTACSNGPLEFTSRREPFFVGTLCSIPLLLLPFLPPNNACPPHSGCHPLRSPSYTMKDEERRGRERGLSWAKTTKTWSAIKMIKNAKAHKNLCGIKDHFLHTTILCMKKAVSVWDKDKFM